MSYFLNKHQPFPGRWENRMLVERLRGGSVGLAPYFLRGAGSHGRSSKRMSLSTPWQRTEVLEWEQLLGKTWKCPFWGQQVLLGSTDFQTSPLHPRTPTLLPAPNKGARRLRGKSKNPELARNHAALCCLETTGPGGSRGAQAGAQGFPLRRAGLRLPGALRSPLNAEFTNCVGH